MGNYPGNAQKGKKGFQPTANKKTSPTPTFACTSPSPSTPSQNEIDDRAREIALLYAAHRGEAPPLQETHHSLISLLDSENEVSGIIAITLPPENWEEVDQIAEDITVSLKPAQRRYFLKTLREEQEKMAQMDVVTWMGAPSGFTERYSHAQRWRALFATVLPSVVTTTRHNEDGSITHTSAFIDSKWDSTVELFLGSSGQIGCDVDGEITTYDGAFSVSRDPHLGAVYSNITEE